MGNLRFDSDIDLSSAFALKTIKPLRMKWYADLREMQNDMLSPSRFADFRLFRPVMTSFPLVFKIADALAPRFETAATRPPFVMPDLKTVTRFAAMQKPKAVKLTVVVDNSAAEEKTRVEKIISRHETPVPTSLMQPAVMQVAANMNIEPELQRPIVPAPVMDVIAAANAAALVAEVIEAQQTAARLAVTAPAEPVVVEQAPVAEAPAVVDAVAPKRGTLKLKTAVNIASVPAVTPVAEAVIDTAAVAPRKTLSLKSKVELAPAVTISRRSSDTDLAAAFKAEMKYVTEIAPEALKTAPAEVVVEKRKSASMSKTWGELMVEAEAPKPTPKSIDLVGAFKREMQALLAEQQRDIERLPDMPKPVAKKPVQKPRALAA